MDKQLFWVHVAGDYAKWWRPHPLCTLAVHSRSAQLVIAYSCGHLQRSMRFIELTSWNWIYLVLAIFDLPYSRIRFLPCRTVYSFGMESLSCWMFKNQSVKTINSSVHSYGSCYCKRMLLLYSSIQITWDWLLQQPPHEYRLRRMNIMIYHSTTGCYAFISAFPIKFELYRTLHIIALQLSGIK